MALWPPVLAYPFGTSAKLSSVAESALASDSIFSRFRRLSWVREATARVAEDRGARIEAPSKVERRARSNSAVEAYTAGSDQSR